MDQLNLNLLLDREDNEKKLIECLNNFEENKKNVLTKRGMYVYGAPGTGKTIFVQKILKKLNYDIIKYDAGDVRNKTIVDQITKHNMSDKNDVRRSIQFPVDLYEEIKKISKLNEMSINAVVVRELRKALNVPVKLSDNKEDE